MFDLMENLCYSDMTEVYMVVTQEKSKTKAN